MPKLQDEAQVLTCYADTKGLKVTRLLIVAALGAAMFSGPVVASDARFPYCVGDDSDSDGDGYGWENNRTCLVRADTTSHYTVYIRNLTYKQVLSPVIAVAHSADVSLFSAGDAASPEVIAIAESGNAMPLADALAGNAMVSGVAITEGPLPPAHAASLTIEAASGDVISVLTMLVNTNDAFSAIGGVELPADSGDAYVYRASTYDAGSESNDELCANIPGPACGGAGPSDDDSGEGFVHVHRGLHGGGDLSLAEYNWRDPAMSVVITKD